MKAIKERTSYSQDIRDVIVRHTLVNSPVSDTSPATEPRLRVTLAGIAHNSHRRLDLLRLKNFLLHNNLHRGGPRNLGGGGRSHDVGSGRGHTTSVGRLLDRSRRLNRVVLRVCDCPGLSRNLDSGLR